MATAGLQAGDIWVSAAPQSPPRHESVLPEPLITYLAPFDSKDHKQLKNGKATVRGAVVRDRDSVARFTQGVQNGQMQSPDPWRHCVSMFA